MTHPRGTHAVSGPRRTHRCDEDADLRRLARDRDAAARERLIHAYLPLAHSVAGRFARSGRVPPEDLQQIAALGLMKALDRFDPDRGVRFPSYAVPTMQGEIRRYFRDFTWTVRPPRGLQDRASRITRERDALTARYGRIPTAEELAERTRWEVEDVIRALEASVARTGASLEARFASDGREAHTLEAHIGGDDPNLAQVEDRVTVARLLDGLQDREQVVLWLRYVDDLTQSDIAERMGCSQMQVSRLLRAGLASLAQVVDARV